MSAPLIALVTLLYLGVAGDQISKSDYPTSLIWIGYAIANVGFIWKMLS